MDEFYNKVNFSSDFILHLIKRDFRQRMMRYNSLKYFALWLWQKKEAMIWIVALAILAISNPAVHHYTLCPLDNLGISYCPGCGLGRSIGYFFRLDIKASFLAHPLGIPSVFLLIYRSVKIIFKPYEFRFINHLNY